MKKVLKKLPKWAVIGLALALFIFLASSFVGHLIQSNRVNERKEQIKERQQIVQEQQKDLPRCPDIWD